MSKNKDGWIRNRGGKCPIKIGELVDIRFRDGDTSIEVDAYQCRWNHTGSPADIMAWRLHKKEESFVPAGYGEVLKVEIVGQNKFDAIAKRDEAIKLNEELHKMHAEYNDKFKKYESIRQELRDQGFELIEKKQ